jgi:transposase
MLLSALPGVGTINLAQVLAEVGPILDRVSNAQQAAAECGAVPVTRASGKASGVYFRWVANPRARNALTAFAHNAWMQSPWAGRLYADARARGKRNPHATRIVARAWLGVIWACWQANTPYHPRAPRRTAPRILVDLQNSPRHLPAGVGSDGTAGAAACLSR